MGSHLHVPFPPDRVRDEGVPDRPVPRQVQASCCHHADDHEQPRQARGSVPSRAGHLRRQRLGVPELGSVPSRDAIPRQHDGHPNPQHVLGTPDGALPEPQGRPSRRHHKRHGDPQLLLEGRVREDVRTGRFDVRTDDCWQLCVHWTAGHRPRHYSHRP